MRREDDGVCVMMIIQTLEKGALSFRTEWKKRMKDWTGNNKSAFSTIGASNHSKTERQEHDYYATEPKATEILLENEKFSPTIWECACGEGHISEVLKFHGYNVISTDLIYRGYGEEEPLDFLHETLDDFDGDIITNPKWVN